MPTESQVTTDKKGVLTTRYGQDPFPQVAQYDQAAKVTISLGRSLPYGEVKVSASVTLVCDQNEVTINRAGEIAFLKAQELVEDCWREALP